MIKIICSYFNYYNDPERKSNYIKFRQKFEYDLITVEVAKDKSEFFIDDAIQIIAKPENLLWQKERCFNIALENLPDAVDKIEKRYEEDQFDLTHAKKEAVKKMVSKAKNNPDKDGPEWHKKVTDKIKNRNA